MNWIEFFSFGLEKNKFSSVRFGFILINLMIIIFGFLDLKSDNLMAVFLLVYTGIIIYLYKGERKKLKVFLSYLSILLIVGISFYYHFELEDIEELFIFIPLLYVLLNPGSIHPIFFTFILSSVYVHSLNFTLSDLIEDLAELIVINIAAVVISILFKKNKKQYEILERSHYEDDLTKLPNLLAYRKIIEKIIKKHNTKEIVLYYLDINKFKLVNETIGHYRGDKVLEVITERLKTFAKDNSLIFRVDGDEFLMVDLLNEVDLSKIKEKANLISLSLAAPILIENNYVHIDTNIGISFGNCSKIKGEEITTYSKDALLSAKKAGINQIRLYDESVKEKVERKKLLIQTMKEGIKDNEFYLLFQPKVDLEGNIKGLEALLRWNHKKIGFVSPGEFIPIAEEEGHIIPLGNFVMEETIKTIKLLGDKGYKNIKVSANLSARQLENPSLIPDLAHMLDKYMIDEKNFELELTESAIMENPSNSIEILEGIKRMGIKISVDDFGIAFSSLSYLQKIPLDTLKVDRFFIKDVVNPKEESPITKAIIDLGHTLGLEVIVEGIETKEQLEFIRNNGCNLYQGFYFSKAIAIDEVLKLLDS